MRPVNPAPSVASQQAQSVRAGDIAFARMEKVNAELVAITYGSLVSHLIRSKDNPLAVQADLDRIGHSMGTRLVDEFLAKFGTPACQSFKESMEVLSKVAVKMFLGIETELTELGPKSFLLTFPENPLNDFVELPPELRTAGFSYSSVFCGIVRGAFEQLHMRVMCEFVKDTLRGDDTNSIQVDLVGLIRPEEEEDDEN